MSVVRHTVSIRSLVIGIAVAVLGLFGLLGLLLIEDAHRRMSDDAGESMLGYARVVGLAHSHWIEESQALLAIVADVVQRGELESGTCTATLADALARAQGYDTFLIADRDGTVLCAPVPLTGKVSLGDRPYFKRALESRKFTAGNYVLGRVSKMHVLPVALPVLDPKGEVAFIVVAGKRADWFQTLVSTLDLPSGTHVALVDGAGGVLAHYPGPVDDGHLSEGVAAWIRAAVEAKRSDVAEMTTPNGERAKFAVVPLAGRSLDLGVVVRQSRQVVVGEVDAFRLKALGLLAGAIVVTAALLLYLLRRNIQLPLERLAAGTRIIRAGDHSWRANGGAGLTVEMAELYESFDNMIGELDQQGQRISHQAALVERSNGDLQNFAYMVSHDLREPLRTMRSFIQLFARRYGTEVDEEGREFIHFVTDGAERMSRMLDGILEYSRIETRANADRPVPLDIPLDQALASLMLAVEEASAQVEREPLPVVMGDPEQIARLLQNLISNGLKFRRPDQPARIRVSARRVGALWEIAVADNGVGLPEHGREQLFLLFRRLVTRDAYPGDGIGLAVCKRIVERHGGTIRAESTPGQGTTMLFTLRAAE